MIHQKASIPASRRDGASRVFLIAVLPLLLFTMALVVCWLISRSQDARSTIALHVDAAAPAASIGKGRLTGDSFELTVPRDNGVAVAVWPSVPEGLADRPIIRCECVAQRPDADVRLIWRREDRPEMLFTAQIDHELGSARPLDLSGNSNWTGRITGLGVAVRGYAGDVLQVRGITAHETSVFARVASLVEDWESMRPWDGQSINLVIVGNPDRIVSPVAIAALLVAVGAVTLRFTRPGGRRALAVVFATTAVAWIALDLRWQADVIGKLRTTIEQYGLGSIEERWRRAPDGDIYALAAAIKKDFNRPEQRVFVLGDDAYARGRAAYHLLPLSVYYDAVEGSLPDASALRSGDLVMMLWTRRVRFDSASSRLLWQGADLHVAPLASLGGMSIFRVMP